MILFLDTHIISFVVYFPYVIFKIFCFYTDAPTVEKVILIVTQEETRKKDLSNIRNWYAH